MSPGVVRKLVEEGAVRQEGQAIAVTRQGGEGPEIWEEVCFIGGPEADAWKLVRSLIGRSAKANESWVFVPQHSPLIHKLRHEGFKRNFSMILFERRAANG